MENVDWVYDVASNSWRALQNLDETKTSMKKMSVKQINENKLHLFERFLGSLI
jgi:hypothetical protein